MDYWNTSVKFQKAASALQKTLLYAHHSPCSIRTMCIPRSHSKQIAERVPVLNGIFLAAEKSSQWSLGDGLQPEEIND